MPRAEEGLLPSTRVVCVASLIMLTALAQPSAAQGPSAPPATAPDTQGQAGTKVDASRGGITISSGVNSLTIGARVQVRWTLDDREEADNDTAGAGEDDADGPSSQFDVPRLRVTLGGGVWREWLKYSFQFDFSRTSGEGDSKIKDAIVEIRPAGRPFRVVVGQFKAPFGLQQLVSSGRQQFVDRAITDAKFAPGREMGAMVAATAASRRIGYELGVFNGSGESIRQNNRSHLWAGRVFFNPLGPYGLSEGAADSGPRPILHVGIGARGGEQIRGRSPASIFETADNQTAYNLELAYKAPRVYGTAEYFWMTDEQRNPIDGRDIDSSGFHAQVGVLALPPAVELALRYARVRGDTDVDDAELTELRGVVGYHWQGHNLKVQADVGQIGYGAGFASMSSRARQGLPSLGTRLVRRSDLTDTQVRVQLQVAF